MTLNYKLKAFISCIHIRCNHPITSYKCILKSNLIITALKFQVDFVISVDVEKNSMQHVTSFYHEMFTIFLLVQNLLC